MPTDAPASSMPLVQQQQNVPPYIGWQLIARSMGSTCCSVGGTMGGATF